MKRIRLLKVEYKGNGFDDLKNAMLQMPYLDSTGEGFRLNLARVDYLKGAYIVKKNISESTLDPNGNILVFDRVEYETFNFILKTFFPEMVLSNAPKSLKPFFTKLSVISDFNIFITELDLKLDIKLNDFIAKLAEISKQECEVIKLHCGSIPVSSSVNASIILSGSEDVRKYKEEKFKEEGKIEKAIVHCKGKRSGFKFALTNKGNINLISGDSNFAIECINESINAIT